jgi:hypothetical protein
MILKMRCIVSTDGENKRATKAEEDYSKSCSIVKSNKKVAENTSKVATQLF